MDLYRAILDYQPKNEQEAHDRQQMLQFMQRHDDYLLRENTTAHFSASMWAVNPARTKVLMVYHNLYNAWAWTGGHADGMENMRDVALKELKEETGIRSARLVSDDIFSLETLTVDGHMRRGQWVPSHLHFNITYLAEVDEDEALSIKADENSGVRWWPMEDVPTVCTEPWMVKHIYSKLIANCR